MLLTTVDAFVFAMIMTGSRKSEIINPDVSNFDYETSEREGYIVQWGTAKERGHGPDSALASDDESDGDDEVKPPSGFTGPKGFFLRRRVEKPILRISKSKKIEIEKPEDVFSVKDVLKAIHKVRGDWGVVELIEDGYDAEHIAKSHDKEISARIRELFPESNEFAKRRRHNQLASHSLRKVYGTYGYLTLANITEMTLGAWMAKHLGWKTSSGLQTSISYSDIQITMIPPKMQVLDEGKKAVHALVKECKAELKCDDDGSDMEDAEIGARIRHRRGLKRAFILLENSETEVQVKLPFHKRRRDGSGPLRAREALRLLGVAGVPATNSMLRDLGYGGKAAAAAIAAGPGEEKEE
jgi:hypothetical protein